MPSFQSRPFAAAISTLFGIALFASAQQTGPAREELFCHPPAPPSSRNKGLIAGPPQKLRAFQKCSALPE